MEEDAGLGNGGLGRLAGELMLCPDWPLTDSAAEPRLKPLLFPQRVSWTPWPLWVSLPTDTAFATSLASSIRR